MSSQEEILRKEISEIRKENQLLRNQLQDFLTNTAALIWASGLDKKCYYFNKAWLNFTGRTLEEEMGDGWVDGVHPDDLENCIAIYSGSFDRREKFSMEYRLRRSDGVYRWLQDDGTPLFDLNGNFKGFIGHCLDITELKEHLRKTQRDTECIQRLMEMFTESAQLTETELFNRVISIAADATQSKIGFLHRVSDDQEQIILTSWNEEALKNCSVPQNHIYPLSQAGNWADCIRQGRPVIYNDYPSSPNQKGLPQGHVPVQRVLSVPVMVDGKARFIFGVGNKESDYIGEDIVQVNIIASEFQHIVEKVENSRKLKNSEALTRAVLNSIMEHVAVIDRSGMIVEVNEPWRNFGLKNGIVKVKGSIEDVNYLQSLQCAIDGGDNKVDEIYQGIKGVIEGSIPVYSTEYECNSPNENRWFQMNVTPLLTSEGGAVITHREITETKSNEIRISESEKLYRLIAENMTDVIWVLDIPEMKLKYISPSVEKLRGYTPAEVMQESWLDQACLDSMVKIKQILPVLIKNFLNGEQTSINLEIEQPCKNGTTVWTEVTAHFKTDPGNGNLLLYGSSRNITEKKELHNILLQDQKTFHFLNKIMSDYIFKLAPGEKGDLEMSIIAGNYTQATGRKLDNVGGPDAWHKIIHPDDLPMFNHFFAQVLTNKEPINFECRSFAEDGTLRWLEIIATPELDPETGALVQIFGSVRNISSRKMADEKLRSSEERWRSIIKTSPDGIAIIGLDGIISYVSDNLVNWHGYTSSDEMLGRNAFDFIVPESVNTAKENLVKMLAGRKAYNVEYELLKKDGSIFFVEVNGEILRNKAGEPESIFLIERDITERRRINLQLKKLSTAVEQSPASIIITDLEGNIEYVNSQFCETTGYDIDEVIGKNPRLVKSDMMPASIYQDLWETLLSGKTWRGELLNKKKNGDLFWEYVSMSPIKDQDGRISNYLAIKEDITEQKRIQELFQESEKKYRILFETMAQGVVYQNSSGIIISANKSAERILGLTLEQMTGRSSISSKWKAIHEDGTDFPGEDHPGMVSLRTGQKTTKVMGVYHPDENKLIWINVNSIPEFREGESSPYQVYTTFEDITTMKSLLNELSVTNRNLEVRVEQRTREIVQISQLHEAILRHAGVAVIATSPDGKIELFNAAAVAMLKYDATEVVGKMTPLVFHDREELITQAAEISMKTGKNQKADFTLFIALLSGSVTNTREWNYVRKDGSKFPVKLTISALQDEKGIIIGYIGIAMDITQEKFNFELLKSSERENKAIISAIPDLLFRVSTDGTYLDSHTLNEKSLMIPKEQFIGKKLREVLPPDLAEQSMLAIESAVRTGDIIPYEYSLPVNNEKRYFENRIVAIEPDVVLSIIRDITERKIAEEQLRETMKKLSILIQSLSGGTLFENEKRQISLVNQSFCDLFNITLSPDQLLGYDCTLAAEITKNLMKDPDGFINRILEILEKGEVVCDDELRMADGRVLERDYIPIHHQNQLLGHLWQYRDITERRITEDYIRVQRDLATNLSAISDLDKALKITLDSLVSLEGFDCGGIYLFDKATNMPQLKVHTGLSDKFVKKNQNYNPDDWQIAIALANKPFYDNYKELLPGSSEAERDHIKSLAIIPIHFEDRQIGIINLGSRSLSQIPEIMRLPLEVLSINIGVALTRIDAQTSLANSKKNLQQLFDTLDDFMFILDVNGNIKLTNPVVRQRLGYSSDQLYQMHVLDVHPPDRRNEAGTIVGEMLAGRAQFCPVPLITASGEQIPVETRVILGQWDDQTVLYGISRDITERQKAEAALRMQSAAFESFALPIIITDKKGKIQWANSGYARLTAYDMSEIIGQYPGTLQQSGKQSNEFYKEMWNTILNNQVWTGELINRRKDGTLYYEEETITPIVDYTGAVSGFIAIKIDITERKAMQKSLIESIEREKELNEMKSKFISVASHEFRTPLATILASSESLLTYRHRMNEEQLEQRLFKIRDKVGDLNRIIEEMLHLSTMQAKEKPLEPETFNMVELVIDCMEDFRNTHGNSVTLLFKHEHDSIGVFLDKKQIKAVLTNLISNAIKYSLPGDPIVCNLSKTDTFITLSISDKGIGIPEDDLKHLFEPFYRASNVINLPGTGLGLNIVKETVDRHQGKISVSSKVGEGSEFRIILPKTI